jgi:hypothetical protein
MLMFTGPENAETAQSELTAFLDQVVVAPAPDGNVR